jgi:probable addiction module antidote protein
VLATEFILDKRETPLLFCYLVAIKAVRIETSNKQKHIGKIIRGVAMTRSRSYKEDLLKSLKDPEEAKEYLNAALEDENLEVFLLALRDVVEANSTMSELARETNRNRESLYKTLSEKGNPQLNSVRCILNQIGFKLAVEVNQLTVNS